MKRSRGFKEKVIDNPVMNEDCRNIALVGTTDGVPFFDDQRRGAWPFFLRVANLPDALSTQMANVFMPMIGANEYFVVNEDTNTLQREIRAPRSLVPHFTVLCDDLLNAYQTGVKTVDYSLSEDDPKRTFMCRAILLFWTGDYPAQAMVSGMHSKACHWCVQESTYAPEINRVCWGNYRQHLPENHVYRNHGGFGSREKRPVPVPRTHEDFFVHGKANESYSGPASQAPCKSTGIKEATPLMALPKFNVVWDILGDMMHIISGVWKRHIFCLLAGNRGIAVPKPRASWTEQQNRKLAADYKTVEEKMRAWELPKAMKAAVDRRSVNLGGQVGWIRNNLQLFKHTSTLTSHDWYLLVQGAGDYILYNIFPDSPRKVECLMALKNACNLCLSVTSACVSENRDELAKVKLPVIEALCNVERYLPKTELAIILHILLHIPDAIYRWNSARNFWAFFGERCMGWLTRFIHNRDRAVENITMAYCRHLLVVGVTKDTSSIAEQLRVVGLTLPKHSLLQQADDIIEEKGYLPGEYKVQAKRSRRNSFIEPILALPLYNKIKSCCRQHNFANPRGQNACGLKKVRFNGRPVCVGDFCVCRVFIRRTQLATAASTKHLRLGRVVAFYEIMCGNYPQIFVEFNALEIVNSIHSLFVVTAAAAGVAETSIFHVDSVVTKVHAVPHFNDNRYLCFVPMWEMR